MANLEIKESAEGTSRSLIGVVFYFNLIVCIIALLAGVVMVLDKVESGLYLIIVAVVSMFWLTLMKALFDTFVNISIKLDKTDAVVSELKSIENMLAKVCENQQQLKSDSVPKEIDCNVSTIREEKVVKKDKSPSVINEVKEDDAKSKELSEAEQKIINAIHAGNEMHARLMLMQIKGMSLDATIAYVNDVKKQLK